MYNQGNFVHPFGQGPHAQQRPLDPNFQHGPPQTSQSFPIQQGAPSVTPQAGYPGPFQYRHAPPPPPQHRPPVQVPTSGVSNAVRPYLFPSRPPQVHAQQNTQWAHNLQPPMLPGPPPLAPPPPGPYRQEMFRPTVPYRGSIYPPHPISTQSSQQLPPPPPPSTSSFFPPVPVGSFAHSVNQNSQVGPTPPPQPPPHLPSSPPPIPPSPPHTSSQLMVSDTTDKDAGTTKAVSDTHVDDGHDLFTSRTNTEVDSPALKDSSYKGSTELDFPPPPPVSMEESVMPDVGTLTHANLMDASRSPSVSDMEMEDDITQPEEVCPETVFIPEEFDIQKQSCILEKDVKGNHASDTVTSFSRSAEEEKVFGFTDHNDQSAHGKAISEVKNLNPSSTGVAGCIGVSYAFPLEDASPSVKSTGVLIKGASPFRLLQDYASDDSSKDDDKPSLEVVSPLTVSPLNVATDASLLGDVQSNFQRDERSNSLSRPELASGMFSESAETPPLPSMPSEDLELLPISDCNAGEANAIVNNTGNSKELGERNNEDQESAELVVSPNKKEEAQHTTALPKVDEFGRRLRDGAVDSDSDDSYHTRKRRRRGRSRSRSRSRSPLDRRRSRWSPRRRRDRRSRSRSWSPKKRRSGSRSPSHRRGGEYNDDKARREKGRLPMCFDFTRGRCSRGGFCRYMHHESDKGDGARYKRSKQQLMESPPDSRTIGFHEEEDKIPSKKSVHEHDFPRSNIGIIKDDDVMDREEEFLKQGSSQTKVSIQDDKTLVSDLCKSQRFNETTAMVLESPAVKEVAESFIKPPAIECCLKEEHTSHGPEGFINESQASLKSADHQSEHVIRSSASDSIQIQTSGTFENQAEISKPELTSMTPIHGDHLELPAPPPSLPQGTRVPPPEFSEEKVLLSSNYPYQAHLQMQQPHYATPPNSWPQPPPMPVQPQFVNNYAAATAVQAVPPPQFQQNQFPPVNNFVSENFLRPFQPPVSTHSQTEMLQHHSYPAPSSQVEDHLARFPISSLGHSVTVTAGNSFPSNELCAPSSQSYTYSLQRQPQPQYGLHQASSDGVKFGDYGNQSSHLSHFGGSKISHHYNPYASTFDQPLDSKFSHLTSAYDASHSLSNVPPVDGQAVGILGLKHTSPLPIQATNKIPKLGSDQYDPLFDSIEPSSNSKKLDQGQMRESTLRLSSSRKPFDVEESCKQKEFEAIAASASIKSNDEYGETADAEVGDVENGSSSNPLDGVHTAVDEVEIDQVRTSGNGKKSKDSRSMKLFKAGLADYVKEVLKPHWRQGGMSKEAFKIIVKKTIDKVSGAMKSHHIPKSQAKINRYIDSSERKLNKLVMGYVDKYAKI